MYSIAVEHDILLHFLLGTVAKSFRYGSLPSMFDKIIGSTESIVIVIWLLISITKDQMSSLTDIDNDAISYVVQCFHINYIPFAQVHNARVTRPFCFLKGLAMPDYPMPT